MVARCGGESLDDEHLIRGTRYKCVGQQAREDKRGEGEGEGKGAGGPGCRFHDQHVGNNGGIMGGIMGDWVLGLEMCGRG